MDTAKGTADSIASTMQPQVRDYSGDGCSSYLTGCLGREVYYPEDWRQRQQQLEPGFGTSLPCLEDSFGYGLACRTR
jgi:hypothetical protein